MKLCLSAACVAAVALAAPAAASAAAFTASPVKACYRSGEQVTLGGTGFTPNGSVNVTSDNPRFPGGSLTTDALGNLGGTLTLGQPNGVRTSTYTATDSANALLTASLSLQVSAVEVGVRPRGGRPGRLVRIKATGFTGGRNLWVHIRKGGYRSDFKVGRLKGACSRLTTRKRFLPRGADTGVYSVQFDNFRRYKKSREVRARYTITVSTLRPRSAAVASVAPATSWDRLF
jgi:hypothetical protein